MLNNKNKEYLIENFKKSIKSTVKAISNKKDVNIQFGNDEDNKSNNISLSPISFNESLSNKEIIRGESDSASLVERYHNPKIHKEFLPSDKFHQKIFNELEYLRCEIIGSNKMRGVKKNIDFLENSIIKNKIKNKEKLNVDKTFKLAIKKKYSQSKY